MNSKEFIAIIMFFIMVLIGVAAMSTSYGANVDIISDFDNNTLTTVEMSDSQSKTIWGFENLAKVQTRTGGDMQNTHIETDEGLWNYEYMILNDTIMDRNDRIYGKNGDQTLYAHYSLTPYCYADITIIDEHGNSGGFVNFPRMTQDGDSVTHTFKPFIDYDDVHYEPFFIQDIDTKQVYQPDDNFTITYSDCIANNGTIHKVFKYIYGYYPDYTVNFISINNETGEIFDNTTITINRQNWSAFYTLPNAPEIAGKVLDFIYIVEDGLYNYHEGDTYQVDYDMALSEGNNITRHFEYNYKQGAYANVTVNYIFNIDNELNNTIFHREYYPMLVIGDEAVGGYVDYHIDVAGYNFTGVTFQEIITNGVKAMLPGSNIRDEGGFWIYEVTENGNIDLNFLYNYKAIEVIPTPEPTPTPTPSNETVDNDTNETEPVIPTPSNETVPSNDTNKTEPVIPDVPIVPVDNETNKGDDNNVIPARIDNNINNNNTNNVWITSDCNSDDCKLSDEPIAMQKTGNDILFGIFVIILLLILLYIVDREDKR
jgi:hypothetical protein